MSCVCVWRCVCVCVCACVCVVEWGRVHHPHGVAPSSRHALQRHAPHPCTRAPPRTRPNSQVAFTTDPKESRSSPYCTGVCACVCVCVCVRARMWCVGFVQLCVWRSCTPPKLSWP
jgi:hypothetical protein